MSTERVAGLRLRSVVIFALACFAVLTVLTVVLRPNLERFYPLLPDKGPDWYYWQLPSPTALSRATAWAGYAAHQVVIWLLLALAARGGLGSQARPRNVGRFNLLVLGVNLLFVGLHLLQTQLFYDGLAQDVPIWTSQGSVIVMLVLILYLMIPARGLFWGRAFTPPRRMLEFLRTWHGPYIAWATVYTFWFHPMEGNWGLVSGFVYMFLLFIQLSLFNTSVHYNKSWVVLLEVFVAVHGTIITVYKSNPIWPMFLFGFLWVFVLTQLHTWKLPAWLRWGTLGLFLGAIALVYGFVRGFGHVYEVLFIPVALYGGALALLLLGLAVDRIAPRRQAAGASGGA